MKTNTLNFTEQDAIKEVMDGYINALLFTSIDDNGLPLDKNYSKKNITPDSMIDIYRFCKKFYKKNAELVAEYVECYEKSLDLLGHELCMTSNRHGCGFWEMSGKFEALGEKLTEASHDMGDNSFVEGKNKTLIWMGTTND